jgi:prolyl 4-hydroxylase
MQNDLQKLSPQVIAECTNRDELCAFWAALGECTNNPEFMSQECGPSCQNCGKPVAPPCPSLGTKAAIEPGGLYDMFERIVSNAPGNNTHIEIDHEMTNYTVQILSRPQEKVLDVSLEYEQHPWIISFDNFLTDEECDKLIELGYVVGYVRSLDAGEVKADGSFEGITSDDRTSSGAFCGYSSNCRSDDVAQRIHDRIAKVTGIPVGNSEDLQILKYEVGNKYGLHHDFVDQQLVHQCGPRILTFFLYLNNVEEGGETAFPYLGIQVKPKRGTAVLWPNVFSSDPKQKDLKTAHEAKAVIKGRKYGVNSWLHMYEYIDLPCGFNPL